VITLLQLLADAQAQGTPKTGANFQRGTILLLEEPELYLHPQMERLMRDVLHRLATQPNTQVACCTHSPIFLDIANKYRSIVRIFKNSQGDAACHQVNQELFPGSAQQADKQRLQTVARFHPTVNELFFANSVVLLEEGSALAAFERGAELMGLFQKYPRLQREVTLVDCNGKKNIPAFQRVLNAFQIPYRVVHDADTNNPAAFADNATIAAALPADGRHLIHQVLPDDLESLLGYSATKGNSKPYTAVCTVENLHAQRQLPT
ncbi:MAG: ATP-dependent nuclease, partial [Castellaniella sp.]